LRVVHRTAEEDSDAVEGARRAPASGTVTSRLRAERLGASSCEERAQIAYQCGFHAELRRVLERSHPLDWEDIATFGYLEKCGAIEDVMASHPDPVRFARISAANLARDYFRREAADDGRGARFGRTKVGVPGVEEIDLRDAWLVDDIAGSVARRIDHESLVAVGAAALTSDQWIAIHLVDLQGLAVSEAAELIGIRRETMSRRLSSARDRFRDAVLSQLLIAA